MNQRFLSRLKGLLKRIKRNIYTNQVIFVLCYKPLKKINVDLSGLKIEKVSLANINDALTFQSENQINYFKQLLAKNNIGFYAYVNDVCVNRNWVQTKGIINISPFVQEILHEGYIYIHAVETDKNYRGKGIQTTIIKFIINEFYNKKVLIAINQNNLPSLRTVRKNNFQVIRKYDILIIFGFKLIKKSENNEQ